MRGVEALGLAELRRRGERAAGGADRAEAVLRAAGRAPVPPACAARRGPARPSRRACSGPRSASRHARFNDEPPFEVQVALARLHGEALVARAEPHRARAGRSACGTSPTTVNDVGQPQRAEAARLGPHAVRDRLREAERARGQRVEVDRVAVARDARRSGGPGRRAAATRRSARAALDRPRARTRRRPCPGADRSSAIATRARRRRAPWCGCVELPALRCSRRSVGADAHRAAARRSRIGRRCVISFSTCTSPTTGNGKTAVVISSMCSGKASMCG